MICGLEVLCHAFSVMGGMDSSLNDDAPALQLVYNHLNQGSFPEVLVSVNRCTIRQAFLSLELCWHC